MFVLQKSFQQMWHYNRVAAKVFIWLCIWLLGAFFDLLAFGSVKSVKIEFFYKREVVFFYKKRYFLIKSAWFHKIQCFFVLQESFQQLWHYKRVAAQVFYMTLHLVVRSIFWPFGFWVCKDNQNWVFYKRGPVFYKIS